MTEKRTHSSPEGSASNQQSWVNKKAEEIEEKFKEAQAKKKELRKENEIIKEAQDEAPPTIAERKTSEPGIIETVSSPVSELGTAENIPRLQSEIKELEREAATPGARKDVEPDSLKREAELPAPEIAVKTTTEKEMRAARMQELREQLKTLEKYATSPADYHRKHDELEREVLAAEEELRKLESEGRLIETTRATEASTISNPEKDFHESFNTDATPAESRKTLRTLVEKMAAITDVIKGTFEKPKIFLANRSQELSAGLRAFGLGVAGDFEAAGRGIKHAAPHPTETVRAARIGAERAARYAKYFTDREVSFGEKKEKLKVDLKVLTERYNKLPLRQKLYITAALIGTSSAAAAAALPTLSSVLASGMAGVRVLGGAGFALNRRKGMEARIAKYPEHWLADKSDAFKNRYALALGALYTGGTWVAGHYAMEKLTDWLGHVFGHATPEASTHSTVVARGEIVRAPVVTAAGEAVIPAPEMPSVTATAGHGYEYMAKRLWHELQQKHLDPSKYPKGSDIRQLLKANDSTINGVVHKIAANPDPEHHFFNHDGTNVLIHPDAHMTIGTNGQIHVSNGSIDVIKAPEGAPVTPIYPPEVVPVHEELIPIQPAVSGHEALMPPDSPQTPNLTHTPDLPPQQNIDTTPAPPHPPGTFTAHPPAPESPIMGHEIVNKFGYKILPDEPHFYAGAKTGEVLVYGGSLDSQFNAVYHYLMSHPDSTIYGTGTDLDTKAIYRVPFSFPKGTLTVGDPVKNTGLIRLFSHWMKAPEPNDLRKLIQ